MATHRPLVAVLALLCNSAMAAGYRFEAPDVVDLAVIDPLAPLAKSAPLVPAPLAADAAQAILAAPEVDNEAKAQLPLLDGDDKAARKHEGPRLAVESATVRRAGHTLSIQPKSGAPVLFVDRPAPRRADADEDGELFVYAGRVGTAGYHRVEERFQQDAPGSYLVSPGNGKSLFVSNGSYVVQLSPDGKWLLSMSGGDTHALMVVMALEAEGPRLSLLCRSPGTAGPAAFKGWRDAASFDLVLGPIGPGNQGVLEHVPLRFALGAEGWGPAGDAKALERLGYVCRR